MAIKDQNNISFIISSSQNIDRIVSAFRACKRTGKTLIIDIYTAWILEQIKLVSSNTQNIEWDHVCFYADHRQNEILKVNSEYFGDFSHRLYKSRISKDEINANPSQYLYLSKMSKSKLINFFKGKHPVNVIYSQWLGYLKKSNKEYFEAEEMKNFQNDPLINFVYTHTSGHATVNDLQTFGSAINAKKVLPKLTQ